MVEERNENLQDADGKKELSETQPENNNEQTEKQTEPEPETLEETAEIVDKDKTAEEVVGEIDENLASDSEDEVAEHSGTDEDTHHIPLLSYKDFDLKALLQEGQKLLENYPVQKIKKHFDELKSAFENKVAELESKFKEENPEATEVHLDIPEIKELNYLFKDYKHKLNQYRKEILEKLENNYQKRLTLIDELKKVIDSTEYTFEERLKKFKEIQKQWRTAGSIPRSRYSDTWQTFKHHEERFYDLLDLDRDYRDKVFQENLEEKKAIIEKAKALLELNDIHKIFNELQALHKKWKEETGPVARDQREAIWEEFKDVTKKIHDKRRDFYKKLKAEFQENLVKKQEIIEKLKEITAEIPENHKDWQAKIKEVEALRESFYQIGYVPKKYREKIWEGFKTTIKDFNKHKNSFYKSLKELQKQNLELKQNLIRIAEEWKDSEDWETATQKFKDIQEEWKKIGHVPRRYSEKLWKEFRNACNHYFDRFHQNRRNERSEEMEIFFKKKEYLHNLKEQFKDIPEDVKYTIDDIKKITQEWKEIGFVPAHKHYINVKFNKFISSLYDKLNIDKRELSFLKFKNTVDSYYENEQFRELDSEKRFVRRKIETIEKEIQQLENNIMFIKSDDKNNPFKKDAENNINKNKEILKFWKKKLDYLNNLDY